MLLAAMLVLAPVVVPGAGPSGSAPASDITPDGWTYRSWYHLGNILRGEVSAESWADLDWPCFTDRDIDQNCDVQRIRGHGLVQKESKVSRVEIGLVRLGRYPAGTLVENDTGRNSGTLAQTGQTTAWYPVTSDGCATTFRAWTRTSFAVRWTDGRLSKLSLLSDPTTSQVCRQTATMTPAQRQHVRSQLHRTALPRSARPRGGVATPTA
jgi:hypothetical protein